MNPQRPLIDDRVGPGARDQPILTDCLAGAFDKRDQDVESPTAEAQRLLVFEQHPLRRDQPKRSKDEGFFIHRGHPKGDFHFILTGKTFRNATAGYRGAFV